MASITRWTDAEFEKLSWHDNHVHGIQIHAGEHGTGELILDLDYIVEWLCGTDRSYQFRIAPATLIFHQILDLNLSLNYAASTAAIVPFSIDHISREPVASIAGRSKWSIHINWPEGAIAFEGGGFTQFLRSEPILTTDQMLSTTQR